MLKDWGQKLNSLNDNIQIIVEKLKFHKLNILNCGDIKAANSAYNYAIKEICISISTGKYEILKELLNLNDPIIINTIALFILPISEIKTFKHLIPLFLKPEYSLEVRTLWSEYKIKNRLQFPKLINGIIEYVSKEEYLKQFSKEDIKYISSFI